MIIQIRSLRIFWLPILFSVGCSRPNPNPELIDPIYLDLSSRATTSKAAAELLANETKSAKEELEKAHPRDPSLRKLRQDLKEKESKLIQLEQQALYYEIRSQQRKDYAREDYLSAYQAGRPWPNPETKRNYDLVEKIQSAPREWGKSVPRTDRYNRKSIDETRKQIEAASKSASKTSAKTEAGGKSANH